MQPIGLRVGALTAGARFVPGAVAILVVLAALSQEMRQPWRLALAAMMIAVFLASYRAVAARGFLLAQGAAEAALVVFAAALFSPLAAFAAAMLLAATQGLHSHYRVLGGVAGFMAAAWLDPGVDTASLALGTLAYLAVAAMSAVLHFQARASMRNFRAFGHEFRTPLTNILQNAHMGLRTSPSAAQREYLGNIALAARHMDMLLSNVLDFLKLLTGNYVANASDVDILHLLDTLTRLVQPLREQQRVRIHAFSHGPLVQFRTNVDALRMSLLNLMSNAIKFTRNARVAVITRTFKDGPQWRLRVRVVDEGTGVPPALRASLFTEFATGEPWNPVQRGTGLGLALVRELVQRLGGTVFYHPRETRGSEFGFEIPIAPAGSPELAQTAPGSFLLVSKDTALCEALASRAKQVERIDSFEALKAIAAAQPRLAAVAVVDARDLTTSIDRAGVEFCRICNVPIFAVVEPAGDLAQVEADLALSGFRSVFDARTGAEAIAESVARTASSVIPDVGDVDVAPDLRARFSGRVLVVEDDPMQLRYLALTLGHSGIVAATAGSLAEARAALADATDIRLLIVDYNLPDGTASPLIADIRNRERASGSPRLPIAVITAEDRQLAIKDLAGVDYDWFQSKPITDPLRFVRMALKRLDGQQVARAAPEPEKAAPAAADLSAILAPDFALAVGEALMNILADVKDKRWDAVYRQAHKMKGLAALMNERRLVDICAQLRRHSPEPEHPAEWLAALESEARAAIDRAEAHRDRAHA